MVKGYSYIAWLIAKGALCCGAGADVQAATLTFGFDGARQSAVSFSETVGGVTATATATGGRVHRNQNNGLGVTGTPNRNRLGLGETLTFNFSQSFTALSIVVFESQNQDERFGVTINGTSTDLVMPGNGNGVSFGIFDLAGLLPANGITSFAVYGREPDSQGNRGIRLSEITITTPDVAPVPLPLTGSLLLAGLGGLHLVRRRKTKAADNL